MCVYVYFLMYHFLRGVNHLKCLEVSLQILPVQVKPEHICGSVTWAMHQAHHQPRLLLCVCQAQRKWSTQDVLLLHFGGVRGGGEASVGKGRAPESGYLEGPVLWLRYEYTWYQTHTRADIKCQESMASHRPKAERLERWGQLYTTWKVYDVFLSQIPKKT